MNQEGETIMSSIAFRLCVLNRAIRNLSWQCSVVEPRRVVCLIVFMTGAMACSSAAWAGDQGDVAAEEKAASVAEEEGKSASPETDIRWEKAPPLTEEEVWEYIVTKAEELRKIDDPDKVQPAWIDAIDGAAYRFHRMCNADDYPERISALMEHFGEGDPVADLLLMWADPRSMVTTSSAKWGKPEWAGERALATAKAQVQLFLKRPDLLSRYQYFIVWTEAFYGRKAARAFVAQLQLVRESLGPSWERGNTDRFWWDARKLLVMVVTANQQQLLKDREPGDLPEVAGHLYVWAIRNGAFLRPDPEGSPRWIVDQDAIATGTIANEGGAIQLPVPSTPFADWPEGVEWVDFSIARTVSTAGILKAVKPIRLKEANPADK